MSKDQKRVFIGGCLFQLAMIGMLFNSNSSLLAAIRQEYAFSMTRVSFFNITRNISGALLAGLYAKLFYSWSRARVMLASLILIASGYLLLVISPDTWIWFLAPVLICSTGSVAVFAVPDVIRLWFPEKSGTPAGIAMAFSGLGGVLFNPFFAFLVEQFGWRTAVLISGAFMLMTGFAAVRLIFYKPLPVQRAVEKESKEEEKTENKNAFKRFVPTLLALMGSACSIGFVSYLSIYAQTHQYQLMDGAVAVSFVMAGNISSKLLYGFFCDRIGTWKTTACCNLVLSSGLILLAVGMDLYPLFLLSSFFLGFSYPLSSLAVPRCCLAAYGGESSKKMVGLHSGINCGTSAVCGLMIGWFFDSFGRFEPLLLVMGAIAAVAAFSAFYSSTKLN